MKLGIHEHRHQAGIPNPKLSFEKFWPIMHGDRYPITRLKMIFLPKSMTDRASSMVQGGVIRPMFLTPTYGRSLWKIERCFGQ